ncbi:hypothetical protein JW898_02040 [Candidatus Woesearchaeota archaeon]|nr:hypothetical protein [Candidatus Woesearchaeota archaeon]
MGIGDWFKGIFGKEEEPQEPMRACDRCGFEFPEMSLVISGENQFCGECNDKIKKDIAEAEFRRKQALATQRTKFYCYECRFHFSRKKDFPIRLCPNCGSENFVEEGKII